MDETLAVPHNLEAERSVLGAVFIDNGLMDVVAAVLNPEDFYRDAHARLYRALLTQHSAGRALDFLTIKDALARQGDLEEVGGPAYLSSLIDGVPHSSNVEHYVGIIKEDATLRGLMRVGQQLLVAASTGEASARELKDRADAALLALNDREHAATFATGAELAADTRARLDVLMSTRSPLTGLSTGFRDLDADTRGLQPGTLVVIGARPSMGKTSMGLQVALHAAVRLQRPTVVFSLEMTKSDLALRAVTMIGHVDASRVFSGLLSQTECVNAWDAIDKLAGGRLAVNDTAGLTPIQVRSLARLAKRRDGVDLVVIDYLQIMRPDPQHRKENRTFQVGQMALAMKELAKELQVPVVLLSQLNRMTEGRADKRPSLADLRESGDIEAHADSVWLLHRPEYYQKTPDNAGLAEVILAKQRNAPTGTVQMAWVGDQMRFADRAREYA